MKINVLATENAYSSPEFIDFCFEMQDAMQDALKGMCLTQEELDAFMKGFYEEVAKYAK